MEWFLVALLGPFTWDHVAISTFCFLLDHQAIDEIFFYIYIFFFFFIIIIIVIIYRQLSELRFSLNITSCLLVPPIYILALEKISKLNVGHLKGDRKPFPSWQRSGWGLRPTVKTGTQPFQEVKL